MPKNENRTGNVRCCSSFPLLFPKATKTRNLLIISIHALNRGFESRQPDSGVKPAVAPWRDEDPRSGFESRTPLVAAASLRKQSEPNWLGRSKVKSIRQPDSGVKPAVAPWRDEDPQSGFESRKPLVAAASLRKQSEPNWLGRSKVKSIRQPDSGVKPAIA
jgi:hypothetical protein